MIKKALEIEPNNGAYLDSLGWLYFKKGQTEEAIKELEKASALLKDPVIFDHLGDAYFKIGDIENAKNNWQESLSLEPAQDKVKEKLEKIK
jgi:tetratricopeptide (TPR) repeat protein